MYLTIRQQVKHLSRTEFHTLRELCRAAKNLTNEALYTVRQHFFATGKYLSYPKCYKLLKNSTNYRTLNSNMAQQILKEVDGSFKSFFGLLKKAQKGDQYCKGCRLPHYLPKDGYATLIIGYIRISGSELILPYSNTFRKTHRPITIRMPAILKDKIPTMTEEEQLKLLATNGMLVKRPLVVMDDAVLVGFKEADWTEKLN